MNATSTVRSPEQELACRPIPTRKDCIITVTDTTKASGWTFLGGNASLTRYSAHSSYAMNVIGELPPGINASGVNEDSTSTNLIQISQAVAVGVAVELK